MAARPVRLRARSAPSWEEFRLRLKRNIRESLRHCYNSLKRDNLEFELQVLETPSDVRRVWISSWSCMSCARHSPPPCPSERFASPVARDFLYEICDRLARRGIVRLFQLKIGSQIVAARIGFVVGTGLYLYYSGYDPKWARYSVMTTTVAEAIKYAIATGSRPSTYRPRRIYPRLAGDRARSIINPRTNKAAACVPAWRAAPTSKRVPNEDWSPGC